MTPTTIGALLSLVFIAITARLLYKQLNPQTVLIASGILMLALGEMLGIFDFEVSKPTGLFAFNLFKTIDENFISNLSRAGFMIMTIGGYVAFMNKIKATDALVYVSMKPLGFFRKYPYLAATMVIPIGQVLFMTTPSAAGIGLLLVASIYPVLVNLGVSKLTALSVISAATLFDQGPGSANTALAAELIGQTNVSYFINHQVFLVVPTTLVVMTLYFFSNKYFDRKDALKKEGQPAQEVAQPNFKVDVPLVFALLPVLPLLLLVIFSQYMALFNPPIVLDTTTAMLVSVFISTLFIGVKYGSLKRVFEDIQSLWKGMGNVFSSVVTLIVAAEIFSKGLISLGFIDSLVGVSSHLGLSGVGITIIITIILFMAAMLMGSGNAAFFSFGPLIPSIATKLGLQSSVMILPMQLSASMGRATSPIAGVIVAMAGVAGVPPMEIAKRNLIPAGGGMLFMLCYHLFIS